jgi:hypothetical protein
MQQQAQGTTYKLYELRRHLHEQGHDLVTSWVQALKSNTIATAPGALLPRVA